MRSERELLEAAVLSAEKNKNKKTNKAKKTKEPKGGTATALENVG